MIIHTTIPNLFDILAKLMEVTSAQSFAPADAQPGPSSKGNVRIELGRVKVPNINYNYYLQCLCQPKKLKVNPRVSLRQLDVHPWQK